MRIVHELDCITSVDLFVQFQAHDDEIVQMAVNMSVAVVILSDFTKHCSSQLM